MAARRRVARPAPVAPRTVRRPRDRLIELHLHVDATPREVLDTATGPFERRVGVIHDPRRTPSEAGEP